MFDAYGTLFDVHSVTALAEATFPGRGGALSQLWRTKQLEYTWLHAAMGTYVDFDAVTAAGLRYACASLGLDADEVRIAALIAQYAKLETFAEVPDALAHLRVTHHLAILSNGTPDTLRTLVTGTGLDGVFAAVISVDSLRTFKPDMRVYRLAVDRLGIARERIGFVSSNCWDAIAAKHFGFTAFWVNRQNAPLDLHGVAPDHIVRSLEDLAPFEH
ncbi:MAG: haloacid dehalogenase type II [Gammaproteobacteria bacterium]